MPSSQSVMFCSYCRGEGHVKGFCPVLEEKIIHKKNARKSKKAELRYKNLVEKFGTSDEALDGIYEEALEVVKRFRSMEEDAYKLEKKKNVEEFEKMCKRLANEEENYEDKLGLLGFLENSKIEFIEYKRQEKKEEGGMFSVLMEC